MRPTTTHLQRSIRAAYLIAGLMTAGLQANAAPIQWRIVTPKAGYGTPFVAGVSAQDFGVIGDGVTDATSGLQAAIDKLASAGGGTVFVPAGHYAVRGHLDIPSGVCLRGEWRVPGHGAPISGTVLMAYSGRGQDDPPRKNPTQKDHVSSFITLENSACIRDLAVWYPEQDPSAIVPYPAAILLAGSYATVDEITFVNAYLGVACAQDSGASCFNIRNIMGSPLSVGVEIDNVADVGRLQHVDFSPAYWTKSGLPGSSVSGAAAWVAAHGTGVVILRNDWSYSNSIAVAGYGIGMQIAPSVSNRGSIPNGYCDNMTFHQCGIGIDYKDGGIEFSHVRTTNCATDVKCESTFVGIIKLHTCSLGSPNTAIENDGTGRILVEHCTLRGKVFATGGLLTLVDSSGSAAAPQVTLAQGVVGASFVGDRFTAPLQVDHSGSTDVQTDASPHPTLEMPEVTYADASTYHPAKNVLYVITDAPYSAVADKVQDATSAIERAAQAAEKNGGGIVFIPPGEYAVRGALTIPAGVELRGAQDWPHDTLRCGSVLDLYAGKDLPQGKSAIRLERASGVSALTCDYPEQRMDQIHTYPFMIQLLGSDAYATDIAALNPYGIVDAASYRCDRHYIARFTGSAVENGFKVGGGSSNGRIEDCQQNSGVIMYGQESWRGGWESSPVLGTKQNYQISTDLVMSRQWRHFDNYVMGNCRNEVLYNDFCFGGHYGLTLGVSGEAAPTGISFGTAFDQNTQDVHVESIGAGGFPIDNGQFVTVGNNQFPESAYICLSPSFTGTVYVQQSDLFGNPRQSVLVQGGHLVMDVTQLRNPGPTAFVIQNGSVEATSFFTDQGSSLGSADTLGNLSMAGAILPPSLRTAVQGRNWPGCIFSK